MLTVKTITLGLLTLLLFPLKLSAADFENCKIVEVVVSGELNAHVALDCTISNRPSCATAGHYFGFNKSTETGKQYLSTVLTAFAANMNVAGYVDSSPNSCPSWQTNVALLTHLRIKR